MQNYKSDVESLVNYLSIIDPQDLDQQREGYKQFLTFPSMTKASLQAKAQGKTEDAERPNPFTLRRLKVNYETDIMKCMLLD